MSDVPPLQPKPPAPWWWPKMKDILALLSTGIFSVTMFAPLFGKGIVVDESLKGAIMIQWGGVMGYYFGTSQSSVKKDDTINSMVTKS